MASFSAARALKGESPRRRGVHPSPRLLPPPLCSIKPLNAPPASATSANALGNCLRDGRMMGSGAPGRARDNLDDRTLSIDLKIDRSMGSVGPAVEKSIDRSRCQADFSTNVGAFAQRSQRRAFASVSIDRRSKAHTKGADRYMHRLESIELIQARPTHPDRSIVDPSALPNER